MINAEKPQTQKNNEPFEKILVSIETVVKVGPILLEMGDIFMTEDGVYFISYAKVAHYGKIKKENAFSTFNLIGGIGADVAVNITVRNMIKEAFDNVQKSRKASYGTRLSDRKSIFKLSTFYPNSDIERLSFESISKSRGWEAMTCHLIDNKKEVFFLEKISKDFLKGLSKYPKSTSLYDNKNDIHGFYLPSPLDSKKIATELKKQNRQLLLGIFIGIALFIIVLFLIKWLSS